MATSLKRLLSFQALSKDLAKVMKKMNLALITLLLLFPIYHKTLALDCYLEPYDRKCTSFTIPDEELSSIVSGVCRKYPNLPACHLDNRCKMAKPWVKDVCLLSRIVSLACSDKPEAIECESYLSLCRGNSVVSQCTHLRDIPSFPSLVDAENSLQHLCSKLNSDECEVCIKNSNDKHLNNECKSIVTWSKLCQTFNSKGMHPCISLAIRCDEYKNYYGDVVSDICSNNRTILQYENRIPLEVFFMFSKSYLHFSTRGYFLAKYFLIESKTQLLFAISLCVLLGSISMKVFKSLASCGGYLFPDADVNSEYDISDLVHHTYPIWGLGLVKKFLSATNMSSKVPDVVVRILGSVIESFLLMTFISVFIMITASGNLTLIFSVALGMCISYF